MKATSKELTEIVQKIEQAYKDELAGKSPVNSAGEASVSLIAQFVIDQMPVSRQRGYALQLGFDTAPHIAKELGISPQYFRRISRHYRYVKVGNRIFYTRKILKSSGHDAH